MEVLEDRVACEPRIVFCGMAGAQSIKARDHYYETPGNSFWESLYLCGLSPRLLRPEEDALVVDLGLGLTDLVGRRDPLDADRRVHDIAELVDKVERWRPEWLTFTSKTVAAVVARHHGVRRPTLGPQEWEFAGASVFVLPGSSGANRRHDYDGRPNRISWWRDLAALAVPLD